jgi:hypothetical protein
MGSSIDDASTEALNIGPVARAATELDAPTREKIRAAIADAFRNHKTSEGIAPPAACWLVRATV